MMCGEYPQRVAEIVGIPVNPGIQAGQQDRRWLKVSWFRRIVRQRLAWLVGL